MGVNLGRESSIYDEIDRLKAREPVNLHDLGNECSRQAEYYEEAATFMAHVKADMANAVLERDRVRSEVSLDVRNNPGQYGLDKVTEASITAAVTVDQRVQQVEEGLVERERVYRVLSGLVSAFEQRRSMINAAVDLYVHKYYAYASPQTTHQEPVVQQSDTKPSGMVHNRKPGRPKHNQETRESIMARIRELREDQNAGGK